MRLQYIQAALEHIHNSSEITDYRNHTYHSTYPEILALIQTNKIDDRLFKQLALMVYGWMPRVLRIDRAHLLSAVRVANNALTATAGSFESIEVKHIANCLHSVVGASKMLHFINPNVFPIWDSKIQAFRGLSNSNHNMAKVGAYFDYVREVHDIIAEDGFDEFYCNFNAAHKYRLIQSNIEPYEVSTVRAVEASTFELAS